MADAASEHRQPQGMRRSAAATSKIMPDLPFKLILIRNRHFMA